MMHKMMPLDFSLIMYVVGIDTTHDNMLLVSVIYANIHFKGTLPVHPWMFGFITNAETTNMTRESENSAKYYLYKKSFINYVT